ncbi:TldD/PmbA family protein [Hyphococcus luteus]|uniref:Modulator protein n=1 Tax=Hyphococcus luteus TaxID=2058213 RepID=A0A2S7K3M9_9PROT|nr:TldD/PmbA family protein [Marinicaulis flavus]PQA87091.1 modulator protein [Marinicaulis flavus]
MQTKDALPILESLISDAKAAGAEAADAVLYHSVSTGVSWRMGNLEDVERSEGADLGLRVLIGKRQASVSTTDHSKAALKELAERAVAMAKAAPEDPYCGLAPAERLAKEPYPHLDLGDFKEPSTDALKERAAACEEAALAVEGVVNSSGAGASYGEGWKWLMTSHGFFGESGGSNHSVSVSVISKDDNGMETDYDYDSKTHLSALKGAVEVGMSAGQRAVRRLSPKKLKSRTAPVIFDNRLSRSLIGQLAGAVNGAAIARGVSFLKNKMGEKIFADGINIIDDPHVPRGAGSRPFDGEGVANARIDLIKDGVLTAWLLNTSQAAQLDLETNARATRGTGGAPGSGPTNLTLEPGSASFDDLLTQGGACLLLGDMFGPQVNPNTGDYSVGCSGFWVENGEIVHPVSEITIAGNILDMYAGLVPASDLEIRGPVNAPSVFVQAMTIAGD